MIRKYQDDDLNELLDVWYQASLLAHPFLNATFLSQERETIASVYLPVAETWVYDRQGHVVGFIALICIPVSALILAVALLGFDAVALRFLTWGCAGGGAGSGGVGSGSGGSLVITTFWIRRGDYLTWINIVNDPEDNATWFPRGSLAPVELNPGDADVAFAQDDVHRDYDPEAVHRFWQMLVQAQRVMLEFRARFVGKCSPSHFWRGSFDMACTRFSGRGAPPHPGGVPNLADHVAREAYSHECFSGGWWPG